jgi:hypothetical protein
VPLYPELSVDKILAQVKDDPEVMAHLPVYEDQHVVPARKYFFAVVGTLAPEYLSTVIKAANRARNLEEPGLSEGRAIQVRQELFAQLEKEPFFSSKCHSSR